MIEVRRLGPQIGAEVQGVDVKTLDDAGFAVIYRAWLDSNVLVVRDQDLQIEDFLRYSRRFGVVLPHPSKSTRHPEYPEITLLGVNKFGADGALDMAIYRRGAEGWHTDGAYDQEPFKATQLYALAVPEPGRRHALRQHVRGVRRAAAGTEAAARRRARRLHLRWPPEGDGAPERGRPRLDARLPSDHPHSSRDRAQGPLLRSGQDPAHRGARRARERRGDRGADRAA